eukprot:842673_1
MTWKYKRKSPILFLLLCLLVVTAIEPVSASLKRRARAGRAAGILRGSAYYTDGLEPDSLESGGLDQGGVRQGDLEPDDKKSGASKLRHLSASPRTRSEEGRAGGLDPDGLEPGGLDPDKARPLDDALLDAGVAKVPTKVEKRNTGRHKNGKRSAYLAAPASKFNKVKHDDENSESVSSWDDSEPSSDDYSVETLIRDFMDDNKDLKTKPHYRCHKVLMHYQPTFSLSECAMKCKNDEKCNFVAYEAGESRQKLTACQKCAEGGPKVHVPMEGWIVVHAPNTNLDPAHLYDNTDDLKEDEKPEKTSIVFGGNMKEHINRHVAVMTDPFNHTDELRNLFDVVLIAIVLYAIFSVYSKRKNRMIKEKASPRLPTTESNLSKQQFEPIGRMYPAASDMPAGSTFERMVVSSPNHMQMQPGPAASWPGSMQSAAFQQNVPSFMYARTQPSPRSSVTQAYRRQMHASQMLHNPMQSYQMQPAHMQPGSMQSGAMQPGHMHPGAMQPGHMQPG